MEGSDELDRSAVRDAPSATLGTIGPDGRPHLVPIIFAVLASGQLVTVIDHKPKRTRSLQRLGNIERDSRVALLIDRYSEDWTKLWWVRIDGDAHVTESPPPGGLEALTTKYTVYRTEPPAGPWIVIDPLSVRTWTA